MTSPSVPATRPAAPIPESHRDLFHRRVVAYLATLMPNGSPQITPVWVTLDGDHVLVNSAKGRQKDRNMRGRRRVALCLVDPDDDDRYLAIRGTVVEITEVGAREVIDRLAGKYTGAPKFDGPPTETRVTYRIRPDHVHTRK